MNYRRVSMAAVAALSLATGKAFGLPLFDKVVAVASYENPMLQHAAVVCDAWGRCWQTGPYYGGGGYYGVMGDMKAIEVMAAMAAIVDMPAADGIEAGVAVAGDIMTGMAGIGTGALGS